MSESNEALNDTGIVEFRPEKVSLGEQLSTNVLEVCIASSLQRIEWCDRVLAGTKAYRKDQMNRLKHYSAELERKTAESEETT